MTLVSLLDAAFDLLLGGREDDRFVHGAAAGRGRYARLPADEVFVDAITLPVTSSKQAYEAVALQIDRLSPYDPSETVWDVVATPAASDTVARRRFQLVAAPIQVFERLRAQHGGRAIEAFIVDVPDGHAPAVLYDERAVAIRRARRARLALGSAALLASLSFFAHTVESTSAARDAFARDKAQATAAAIKAAQQRATQAQALMSSTEQSRGDDSLSRATQLLAAMSAPAVPGMLIESVSVDQSGARLTGFTDDVDGLEAALRARTSLQITLFSLTPEPDPMGRGRRFEAQLSLSGADEPS